MLQTLAAVVITWGFFHAGLQLHQIAAGVILMAAVAMVQRVQSKVDGSQGANFTAGASELRRHE